MRKQLFSLTAIAATLIASCSKDVESIAVHPPTSDDGVNISIALVDDPSTRATTSTAQTWESSLSSLTLIVFDNSNNLLVKRQFTATELLTKSVSFALPKSTANTQCHFYAIANVDTSDVTTLSGLLALTESEAANYNGTYSEVTSGAKRSGGFVMSGMKSQTVGSLNSLTTIAITIKRTVAKVAVKLTTSDSFETMYPNATLTFNSATISKAASQARVVDPSGSFIASRSYTHTQASSTDYLFYIYENAASSEGDRVLLEIDSTFDADGNNSTTTDRSQITYTIEMTGSGSGAIVRNGYYNVNATINGLEGQDCDVAITVADWETLVSQSVDLGA